VRIGGYIIADNVYGRQSVEEKKDKDTLAIHQYT